MKLTYLLAIENGRPKGRIHLQNREGKGTNVSKLEPSGVGTTSKMPVPWWSKNHFGEHHIQIFTYQKKLIFYLWQYGADVFYRKGKFPTKGGYGKKLNGVKEGDRFILKVTADGLVARVVDTRSIHQTALGYKRQYDDLIDEIKSAVVEFGQSNSGQSLISEMEAANLGDQQGTYTGNNFVRSVIDNDAFSGLNLGGSGGPSELDLPTITAGVGASAGLAVGGAVSAGLAFEPAADKPELAVFLSGAVTLGVSGGGGTSFEIGFWTAAPADLGGFGYVAIFGFTVAHVGVEVTVALDSAENLAGIVIGLSQGGEFSMTAGVGTTEILWSGRGS